MVPSMAYIIHTLPCRSDNFAFVIEKEGGGVAIVDAPEAGPILSFLEQKGLTPDILLLTHHHHDHVEATEDLRALGAEVWGAGTDAHRLPPLDRALTPGETMLFGDRLEVIDVPGHTVGHIAFHLPAAQALFSADSLMAMGCGRLFEGTAAQMWQSLLTLRALPDDTIVYSGHEYTAANCAFALTVEPESAALAARSAEVTARRARGEWTVPSRLSEEKATNPFLRADLPAVKAAMGMEGAADVDVFAAIRSAKDRF